jgi:deazaflavin-dependent oxidoreductase (nitroreductase family)
VADHPSGIDDLPFAYVTTTGRRSGRPHRIEIWFARRDRTLYLLAGGGRRSDWVANALAHPKVTVEVGDHAGTATARVLDPAADADEDATARRLVFDKYQPGYDGDLTGWRSSALPVALDLDPDLD